MAWLAVHSNGEEGIFTNKPIRRTGIWWDTQYTDYSGGGQHTQSCSAPTTAIFGTEQHNFSSFGGEVICLGLIFLT